MSVIESAGKKVWRLLPQGLRDRVRSTRAMVALRNWFTRRRYKGATHDEIFDEDYFRFVDRTTLESAGVIADAIVADYAPRSVWDVGCGTGALLECFRVRGTEGYGLELAEAALEFCRSRHLNVRKFNILEDTLGVTPKADVVISMEVGAQLQPTGADRYVDLLCGLGPVIVFSAEEPGGGDRVALNEQPHQYWISKFADRGYQMNQVRSHEWRTKWKAADVAPWFCRNVLVFERH